jgi:hypothetical protein
MLAPLSLVRGQNHAGALSFVGISNDTGFPTITQCPKCHKSALRVFADAPADGLWLTCRSCQTHGSIVTFAAQLWNNSVQAAIQQFVDNKLIAGDVAFKYGADEELNLTKEQVAHAFWKEAAAQTWTHTDGALQLKLKEFGLEYNLPGLERLVGVATKEQVKKLITEFPVEHLRTSKHGSEFLVFRFDDLPERISGFLLVQYNQEFHAKTTFVSTRKTENAGYYLLDYATLHNKALNGSAFIADDINWVLKVQATQLRFGLDPLPLCASYRGDKVKSSGVSMAALPTMPRFFHDRSQPGMAISQACTAKGYVCLPIKSPSPTQIKPADTMSRLSRFRSSSQTWKSALYTILSRSSILEAKTIGAQLDIAPEQLRIFCADRRVPDIIAQQLVTGAVTANAPIPVAANCLIEQDGQWFTGVGRQVANGIIKITDVFQTDNGEQIYRGYAVVNGQRVDFTDPVKKIEALGLLNYVREKVGERGILFIYDRMWNSRALVSTLQMHPPKFTQISNKLGWNENTSEFQFPNYVITNTGTVVARDHLGTRQTVFPEPNAVVPLSIRKILTPAHEYAPLWAGIAAVVGNIVAPICQKNFMAVAVHDNDYLAQMEKIGAQLACPLRKPMGLKGVVNLAPKIDWPHIIAAPFDRKRLMQTITRYQQSPMVLQTYRATSVAATTYGWYALNTHGSIGNVDLSFLPYLLPAYVQHVLQRRMRLGLESDFLRAVMVDLHGWLQETYDATFNLDHAHENLWSPANAATLVVQAIADEIAQKNIDVLPRPRRKDQAQNYILKNAETYWINESALSRRFVEMCGLAPDWVFVREALENLGVCPGQHTVLTYRGFYVDANWFTNFLPHPHRKRKSKDAQS